MISSEIRSKSASTKLLYLISFLISIHYALVAYINSSYLDNFVSQQKIGLLYSMASILTILTIPFLSKLLKKLGQYRTAISILCLDLISILTLAAISSPIFSGISSFQLSDGAVLVSNTNRLTPFIPFVAIISFVVFQISLVLGYIILDIYLEEFSENSETGKDRGTFLTVLNSAFVFCTFIVGKIVSGSNDGFWKIYLISGLFMLTSMLIVLKKFKDVKDVAYHSPRFLETARKVAGNKNILSICISGLLLSFFYSWMVIYMPVYLHNHIGLEWNQIGIVFSIMLTAFVIFELPLGKIADKYLGEKEILTVGFMIIAVSTGALSFITSKSLVVWSIALFMTRVGASAIEVMNDTYFFKKVKATDSDIISFYRNANPIAYIVSPVIASALLYFIEYRFLFLVLSAVMISGVKFSTSIKDTL